MWPKALTEIHWPYRIQREGKPEIWQEVSSLILLVRQLWLTATELLFAGQSSSFT